jgi:chaperone required for assembly of F1-ATPase
MTDMTIEASHGGYHIIRKNTPLHSMGKQPLLLPTQALAEAVMKEIEAMLAKRPQPRPNYTLVSMAVDHTTPHRPEVIEQLSAQLDGETLCYLATDPPELFERQKAEWLPEIAWLDDALGITLVNTAGIMPVAQPEEAHAALSDWLAGLDDYRLTMFHQAVQLTSSIVIAAGLLLERLSVKKAMELAYMEHEYQLQHWGEDAIARKRLDNVANELDALVEFLRFLNA